MNGQGKPFLLSPVGKDYIWGGCRLNDDFALNLPGARVAEAWICSVHPDGESIINSGEFYGQRLSTILALYPELLGTHAQSVGNGSLPVLIKLIDAKDNLSVQVHPDDEYAQRVEGDNGKTECWYVLNANSDSTLVHGFSRNVDKTELRSAVADGSVERLLNNVPIHKNDVFFIPAGTVHAIGKGALIAEVQQSSNVTYRLYDYGRGRETHIDKALDVVDCHFSLVPRQPMRIIKYSPGYASEFLVRCKYFQIERLLLNTEGRIMPKYQTSENSFHALVIIDGCGMVIGRGFNLPFYKGDCLFVPSQSEAFYLHGKAQMLDVSC